MAFVAFLGCDGSGKSAVIDLLATRLRSEGEIVLCGHWRPEPFSRAASGSKLATADDPHAQVPRGAASSIVKLAWLWMNWWVGWFSGLRQSSRRGIVFYDRFHGDLLVDPRRYRYGGPLCLARLACNLMPQPDLVVFLDAEPDVLLSRKQEVSRAALERARSAYLRFAKGRRFKVLDASKPLSEVVSQVHVELLRLSSQD